MGNAIWGGMLAADGGVANVVGLAGLGKRIVSTVKVLALLALRLVSMAIAKAVISHSYLELVRQKVLFVWQLSIHAK